MRNEMRNEMRNVITWDKLFIHYLKTFDSLPYRHFCLKSEGYVSFTICKWLK